MNTPLPHHRPDESPGGGMPVPSPAFRARLRAQLRTAHADLQEQRSMKMRFRIITLSLPAIAVALVVVFGTNLLVPAFSPTRFLDRAYAAALEMGHGGITYEKKREVPGRDAFDYPFLDKEPVTTEDWSTDLHWLTRWTHDDGKVTFSSYILSLNSDEIFSDNRWILPHPDSEVGVCVRPALMVQTDMVNDPFFKPSEARTTAETQQDLVIDVNYSRDLPKRIHALQELLKRGDAVYEGVETESGKTLRLFKVKAYNLTTDSQDAAVLDTDSRFVRFAFGDNYALVRSEEWEMENGEEKQRKITQYLDYQILQKPVEEVFDPKAFGLRDIWTYVPKPKESFRTLKEGQEACYLNGKRYKSSIDMVIYMADHGLDTMNNWTLDVEINGKPASRLDGNTSSQ